MARGLIGAVLTLAFFVSPAAAQRCAPAGVKYIVRSQDGTTLSTAELQTLRAQLPERVGGAVVTVDSSDSLPGLLFVNPGCVMDLQDIALEQDGKRMLLSFNLGIPGGGKPHWVTVDGLPFQEGRFILDSSGWTREGQTLPASSWKSIDELQRTGTPIPAPPRDCDATVQTASLDLLDLRYRAQSTGARSECLKQLVSLIGDASQRDKAENAARGIASLAGQRLIDDKALLAPLTKCVAQHLDQLGTLCNDALEALSLHSYGDVADWTALARLLDRGRPIFDKDLEELTLRTIHEICAALQVAISKTLPDHPVLAHLKRLGNRTTLGAGNSDILFSFAAGNGDPRIFFLGGWPKNGSLDAIRFFILRPGLAQPSSSSIDDYAIPRFPANEADYRERFSNIDLEVRFQIRTNNQELRAATLEAVSHALESMRAADQ